MERRHAQVQDFFAEFHEALGRDDAVREHLQELAAWRKGWQPAFSREVDARESAIELVRGLGPSRSSEKRHPLTDEASELLSWQDTYDRCSASQRETLALGFARLIRCVRNGPDSVSMALRDLSHESAGLRPPLALVTPILSAYDPERYATLYDGAVSILELRTRRKLSNQLGDYAELNDTAQDFVHELDAAIEPSAWDEAARADRFAGFARWMLRHKKDALQRARFSVRREMYKDWPPMW